MIGWILRLILFFIVIRVVWRFLSGLIDGLTPDAPASTRGSRGASGGGGGGGAGRGGVSSVPLVRDPVCGKYIVRERALTAGRADQIQYFCSEQCRDEFARRA